jgi:hypothetical protein
MKDLITLIVNTYYFAIFSIIFGIWQLKDTFKNKHNYDPQSPLQPFLRGVFGSIGLIILGIWIIFYKIIENFTK